MTAFDWCFKCDTKHDLDEPCEESKMDFSVEEHLEVWLEHNVRDNDRVQVRRLMLHEYNSDPDIYDRLGWPIVYRNIEHLIVKGAN